MTPRSPLPVHGWDRLTARQRAHEIAEEVVLLLVLVRRLRCDQVTA